MKPRVGISRCLLGDEVRYDGTHKRAGDLLAALSIQVEWVPVCTEVEVGMGTPREPIHLVASLPCRSAPGAKAGLRLLGVTSGEDWTERMEAWARQRVEAFRVLNLSGFVLKARSPSCGIRDVPIHYGPPEGGHYVRPDPGLGLFARALVDTIPDLPVADEDDLADARKCEAFLGQVRAFRP